MTVEEWKRKNPPIQRKLAYNADKLRAMSDEDLADQFTQNGVFLCPVHNPNCLEADCRECFLEWLKQEASDGQHSSL